MFYTSARLIGNYPAVDLFALREAGLKPHPEDAPYSTYSLEYYVEYSRLDGDGKVHHGLRHKWNVTKDGFPTKANMRKWCDGHDRLAWSRDIELLTVKASLRRCSNGEVMAEWSLDA